VKPPEEQPGILQRVGEFFNGKPYVLADSQKADIKNLFDDSVDLDKMQVKQGGLWTRLGGSHTIGNTIRLEDKFCDAGGCLDNFQDGQLTPHGRGVLIHETTHVWQFQTRNDLAVYFDKASAWVKAKLTGTSQYSWGNDASRGVPFTKLNPEAQAEVIKQYYQNSIVDDKLRAYAEDAVRQVKSEGKP
jgi:hypothetical protein